MVDVKFIIFNHWKLKHSNHINMALRYDHGAEDSLFDILHSNNSILNKNNFKNS